MNEMPFKGHYKRKYNPIQAFLKTNKEKELCVVFDLGSKASRYIIGPKLTFEDLETWNPFNWFMVETVKNELLSYFNFFNNKIDLNALDRIIGFINSTKRKFKNIVPEKNYILVGTEVFRLASNKDEVLTIIFKSTGLHLHILKEESEAFLSLLALKHTYRNPAKNVSKPEINDDDVIILFDQGGGSTEISFFDLKSGKFGEQTSISEMGTNALRTNFFTYDPQGLVDPKDNHNTIAKQFDYIDKLVDKKLNDAFNEKAGLIRASVQSKQLHAFAMGTSMGNGFQRLKGKGYHGKLIHCMSITTKEIEDILFSSCLELNKYGQVYKLVEKLRVIDDDNELDGKLTMLIGLPAYLKLLEKFNLSEIRYSYFNLKHGVFLARFLYDMEDVNVTLLPEKKTPKVGIVYAHGDDAHNKWVKNLAKQLEAIFDVSISFDHQNEAGTHIPTYSEELINSSIKVLIICTPELIRKINKAGYIRDEIELIKKHIIENSSEKKFITVLKSGNVEDSIPFELNKFVCIELNNETSFEQTIQDKFKFLSPK